MTIALGTPPTVAEQLASLLDACHAAGITLTSGPEGRIIAQPASALTEPLRGSIRACKPALLDEFTRIVAIGMAWDEFATHRMLSDARAVITPWCAVYPDAKNRVVRALAALLRQSQVLQDQWGLTHAYDALMTAYALWWEEVWPPVMAETAAIRWALRPVDGSWFAQAPIQHVQHGDHWSLEW